MSRRLPPLNALRAFEAAGRHLSFAAAARELHVTPAAISHQIRALEQEFGRRLFHRDPRRLRLTDAGARLLPDLTEAFQSLARGVDAVDGASAVRLLTVSVVPSIAGKWLVPRLQRFLDRHPGVDVRVDAFSGLVDFARDPEVDMAIRYGRGVYPGLTVEKLIDGDVAPVCAPELVARAGLRTPADLARVPLLHADASGRPTDPSWPEWLATAGVADRVDASAGPRFNYMSYAAQAAGAGQGVALLPELPVADDLAAGRLVRPFRDGPRGAGAFAYYLVAPRHKHETPAVRAFWDWLIEEMQSTLSPAELEA